MVNTRTIRSWAVGCAVALAGSVAAASPAIASNAYLEPYKVKYDAETGESNETTITGSGEPTEDTATQLYISDSGANITPHWPWLHAGGCEELPEPDRRVACTLEDNFVEVRLGDLDDRFSMQHTSDAVHATVSGETGNDWLTGGPASDMLLGSSGADTLRGRGGADRLSGGDGTFDTVDYSDRTKAVRVTLPEPAPPTPIGPIVTGVSSIFDGPPRPVWPTIAGDDGESGERDDVLADVENVNGGYGGDDLIGSSAANRLTGLAGDDYLEGNGGNDSLLGRAGVDALRGGPGDDHFYTLDGEVDWIDCGPGADVVVQADPFDYTGDFAVARRRGALDLTKVEPPAGLFTVDTSGGCERINPD